MATVVVIDDSVDAQHFLQSLCRHRGHEVVLAADGREGLETARRLRPDLVITDALLPTLNGYEVARRIRSDSTMAGTRVMLTTAATVDASLMDLARGCGVTTVIPKPSDPGQVLALLDQTLSEPPPATLVLAAQDNFGDEQLQVLTGALSGKIDELRASYQELKHSEDRFRRLLDLAPAAILGVDASGTITLVNALAEAVFGATAGELMGQPLERLLPAQVRHVHVHHRATYMASPSVRPMGVGRDLEARRLDGRLFPVTVSLSTFGDGADITVLAAVLDITDRIQAQKERARLEATLAQAERLESVGQLAGGVAHDFNNLLAVIINYAAFVAAAVDDPAIKDDVDQISAAARRGADLVRQLLLFSRRQPATAERLDLNAVLVDLRQLLDRSLGDDISLVIDSDVEEPCTEIDRGKLEQVVVNLVVNARDAMPKGGTIRIAVTRSEVDQSAAMGLGLSPGEYLCMTVADTGSGMTAEVMERAFDPFFTTKARGQGTGLGLASVYGIVTEAGGAVRLSSDQRKGTSVSVYLPVTGGAVHEPGVIEEHELRTADGHEVVLVVEDEPAVMEMTRRILVQNNYEVMAAGDPTEVIALIDDLGGATPALVLTDVVMPGLSGPDLVEQLRGQWPGLPALLMSGHTGHVAAQDLAGVDLLMKPFTEQELLAKVRHAIDIRR